MSKIINASIFASGDAVSFMHEGKRLIGIVMAVTSPGVYHVRSGGRVFEVSQNDDVQGEWQPFTEGFRNK